MKLKLALLVIPSFLLPLAAGCAAPGPEGDGDEGTDGTGGTSVAGDGDTTVVGDGDGDTTVVGDGDGTVVGDGDGTVVGDGDGDGGALPTGCAAIDPNNLLSDFESGEAKIAEVGGRSGSWYMSNDGSGTVTPEKIPNTPLVAAAEGACSSASAFHTTGTGFTGWGSLVAVDLVPKVADVKQPYDASAYSGIAFRARAASNVQVRVELSTTDSMEEGGVCDPAAGTGEPNRCGDHFGVNVVLSPEWKDIEVPFAQLTQKGWGLAAAGFDASGVYSVRLKVEGGDYDYTIDDVHFVN